MLRTIDRIFKELVEAGGSDLHLAVNQPPLARVRGEIVPLRGGPIPARDLEEMLLELISPAERARFAADLDLDVAVSSGGSIRLRARYYAKHPGIAAAFRLIPRRPPTLSELGCPPGVQRLAERRAGLVLVAGPAGEGKTTTAAAMIAHIGRTRACHVLTIESPIEFVHEPARAQITQREIGTHAPSFAAALEGAAREDADVVFVSDLSSGPDLARAVDLALGGLLVLTTVPSSSAAGALERLVTAVSPEQQPRLRAKLAGALAGVVVQHLVPSTDRKARVAAHEILLGTPEVAALVRAGEADRIVGVLRRSEAEGMQALDRSLERLVASGKIAEETARDRIGERTFGERVAATTA